MSLPKSVSPEYIKVKNKLRSLQTQLSYPAVYNSKNSQLKSGRDSLHPTEIKDQLKAIQQHIGEHDTQLSAIYDAIENLLDDKVAQKKWEERDRIGFKN